MIAQIDSNLHEKPRWAPIGKLSATTNALFSGKTDKTINEPEHIFIGKHPCDVFTPESILSNINLTSIEKNLHTQVYKQRQNKKVVDIKLIGLHRRGINYPQCCNEYLK